MVNFWRFVKAQDKLLSSVYAILTFNSCESKMNVPKNIVKTNGIFWTNYLELAKNGPQNEPERFWL